jgi:hypothetical protein
VETNLAVLIDFENIAAGTEKEGLGAFDVDAIMGRVKDKGRILIARSYADWGRFARFKKSLLTANVTMMELTSHGMQDKNRADIAMVVDTLELAFTRDYIDTFVVVSGDSDFTPLVLKLRELNKRVIGCGTRSSTSRLLIQACDEFFFYDSLVSGKSSTGNGPRKRKPRRGEPIRDREAAFDALSDALRALQRENPDPPLASVIKGVILRKSPDFSESELGYPSFARFLEAAKQAGYVTIIRDQKSGGYRVDSVDSPQPDSGQLRSSNSEPTFWADPVLPAPAVETARALAADGLNPLAAPTRAVVLEAFNKAYQARVEKKKRVNIRFLQEDARRMLRRSHPDLPARAIRQVFNAVLRTGLLRHRDGLPIRSTSAPFTLDSPMEGVAKAMVSTYLGSLVESEAKLDDAGMLSQLFFGDQAQVEYIKETLEWMSAADDSDGDSFDEDLDLDDLLTVATEPSEPAEEPPADIKAEEAPAVDEKDPETEASDENEADAKPTRKRIRTRPATAANTAEAVTEE